MQIEYNDFCLRSITSEDAESYYEIYSLPEVAKYDDFSPITREELLIDMARIALYTPDSAYQELAVAVQPTDKMIGVITLDKKNDCCYLGYHFHPRFQGKGYAVRSVRALIASLHPLERNTLRIASHPENRSSLSLAKKVGFVQIEEQVNEACVEVMYKFDSEQWETKAQVSQY